MPPKKKKEEEECEEPREIPLANIYEFPTFGHEDVDKNVSDLQTKLKESLKTKDRAQICSAYNQLGTAYYRLFQYDKAELCHLKHLVQSKPVEAVPGIQCAKEGDPNEERIALVNLGCVYHANREYELALQTFRDALVLAEEVRPCIP